MTNGELAFMALAEELNFTRAAERIYMSQQGLSDHIKRLEAEYNTVLVTRKPHVELTQSGEALYNMLNQKSAMETDVKRLIEDINEGDAGDVYVGMATSRVRVFATEIIKRYYSKHPKVRVHIINSTTSELVQMLVQGQIDFIIGKNVKENPDIVIELTYNDPVFIAVPEKEARKRSGDASVARIEDYNDIPYVRGRHELDTMDVIDNFVRSKNLELNNVISVTDSNVQASLCVALGAAMFTSKSFALSDEGEVMRNKLRLLEIDGLDHTDKISLTVRKNRVYTRCVKNFMDETREVMKEFYEQRVND